jgi:hypothetical protein
MGSWLSTNKITDSNILPTVTVDNKNAFDKQLNVCKIPIRHRPTCSDIESVMEYANTNSDYTTISALGNKIE